MKKTLLALSAALALQAAAHADVAYYYGSRVQLDLGDNQLATAHTEFALLTVDYTSGNSQLIEIYQSNTAGKPFDYKVNPVVTSDFTPIASSNGVKYSYLTFTQETTTQAAKTTIHFLLYGPTTGVMLTANSPFGPASVPATLGGTVFRLVNDLQANPASSTAHADNYSLSVVVPATQAANQNQQTLAQAVTAADNYLSNVLGGNKVP